MRRLLFAGALACALITALACPRVDARCEGDACGDDDNDGPRVLSFAARPSSVQLGERSTLSWTTRGAASCSLSPAAMVVPRSGSFVVMPSTSVSYTLACVGGGRTVSADASVTVTGEPGDGGAPAGDGGLWRDGGALEAGVLDDGGGLDGAVLDDGGAPGDGGAPIDAGAVVDGGVIVDAGGRGPRHRYPFGGEVAGVALDVIGEAHGAVRGGASYDGEGRLILDGVDGYVDLPNGMISSLDAVTLEAWVEWKGDAAGAWQRIFDFGTNSAGEITDLDGGPYTAGASTFLQLSPKTSLGKLRVTVQNGTASDAAWIDGPDALPTNRPAHVAVSYDGTAKILRLYLDGDAVGEILWTPPLSAIDDVNCWLGRSNFSVDPGFDGALLELRVYPHALTDAEVEASFSAGPNVLWSD